MQSALVSINNSNVLVERTESAARELVRREAPLIVELELCFSCLAKKFVHFRENSRGKATAAASDKLRFGRGEHGAPGGPRFPGSLRSIHPGAVTTPPPPRAGSRTEQRTKEPDASVGKFGRTSSRDSIAACAKENVARAPAHYPQRTVTSGRCRPFSVVHWPTPRVRR